MLETLALHSPNVSSMVAEVQYATRWLFSMCDLISYRPSPQGVAQATVSGMTEHSQNLEILDGAIRVLSNLVRTMTSYGLCHVTDGRNVIFY